MYEWIRWKTGVDLGGKQGDVGRMRGWCWMKVGLSLGKQHNVARGSLLRAEAPMTDQERILH